MTLSQEVKNYRSICSVRETSGAVASSILESGHGQYFDVDLLKLPDVAAFLIDIIHRDYSKLSDIPAHGRWQHLNHGGRDRMGALLAQWASEKLDSLEICRRLIDLITFSVLIDAGAGNVWKYTEDGIAVGRSEGLAIASYHMFKDANLSSDNSQTVQGKSLIAFTEKDFIAGFQINQENMLEGSNGRLGLIKRLGSALCQNSNIFGADGRPGNIIDYLFKLHGSSNIDLTELWDALMDGYSSIWPSGRLKIDGVSLGDCWAYNDGSKQTIVCFHKLTQWLCYSLLTPLEQYGYKFNIKNKSLQTGLPEYRNGGLFVDFGVITLKNPVLEEGLANSSKLGYDLSIPTYDPEHGAIVEWRCLTIGLLDSLLPVVNDKLKSQLQLPQLIEAGSWKAGREIAKTLRPSTSAPPINLNSDGTVF